MTCPDEFEPADAGPIAREWASRARSREHRVPTAGGGVCVIEADGGLPRSAAAWAWPPRRWRAGLGVVRWSPVPGSATRWPSSPAGRSAAVAPPASAAEVRRYPANRSQLAEHASGTARASSPAPPAPRRRGGPGQPGESAALSSPRPGAAVWCSATPPPGLLFRGIFGTHITPSGRCRLPPRTALRSGWSCRRAAADRRRPLFALPGHGGRRGPALQRPPGPAVNPPGAHG